MHRCSIGHIRYLIHIEKRRTGFDIELFGDDCRIIQTTKAVTLALGIEPCLKPGGCTNTNMALAKGIPGVCLGRGGREYGTHTLNEWFDPAGVEACEQKSILLLLALAGLDDRIKALGETLV